MATLSNPRITLLGQVTCPHCWSHFAPEDALWIAEHPDLVGDPRLGETERIRFLPSRFSTEGDAIDPQGYRSTHLACPNCHLEVPRPLFQIAPLFYSILGAPACGKSYFLASMTWQLRQILPQHFQLTLSDADPAVNSRLHQYEEQQFLNPNPDELVALAKTETQGDLYDQVNFGDHSITFPRPFLFSLQPTSKHLNAKKSRSVARVLCLYDNAGESFLPGADTFSSPVTRHLAHSACLFFCFDPTQDPRFRKACAGISADPQMQSRSSRLARETNVRQDTILIEAAQRIRRHAGLREDELHQRPLVIIVTKWDSWQRLCPELTNDPPYIDMPGSPVRTIDNDHLLVVSDYVEKMLRKYCPEIVAAAEGFAREIVYIPVSATGVSPEVDAETGGLGIRPRDIAPYWVEVPMLYALARWSRGLIGLQQRVNFSRNQILPTTEGLR